MKYFIGIDLGIVARLCERRSTFFGRAANLQSHE
jgi:hypothetical protein